MRPIETASFGGQLNELFVLASLRAGPKHGYRIAAEAQERSHGIVTMQHGTLYPILHKLERHGMVRSRWLRADGRRRRQYELTHAGASRLRYEATELKQTFERIIAVLTDAPRADASRDRVASPLRKS